MNITQLEDGRFLESSCVEKMFPISFERPNKYDRVISEENLVDWFRGVVNDSTDSTKNSRYSYVITESLDSNFGKTTTTHYLEFMLGGYYVKLTDQGFSSNFGQSENGDIYAVIREVSSTEFRHLEYGDGITNGNFSALSFVLVGQDEPLTVEPNMYKLHILTKSGTSYIIPPASKRATYTVDGGEIS